MNITLAPEVAIKLETITVYSQRQEYSGFGWARKDGDGLYVYDIILLHVGSEGLTIIPGEQVMELTKREDASNMRVWFHRHPLGNRTPGWHNWSGTDNQTIAETPLGGIPEIVKWSASIVRTPQGWVGRIDNHITRNTVHVNVLGQAPLEIVNETTRLLNAYYTEVAARDAAREMELKKRNRQYDSAGSYRIPATGTDLQWLADQLGVAANDIYVDDEGYIELFDDEADEDADPFGIPTWLHKEFLR